VRRCRAKVRVINKVLFVDGRPLMLDMWVITARKPSMALVSATICQDENSTSGSLAVRTPTTAVTTRAPDWSIFVKE
jgi:hypothetical protein